MKWSQRAYDIQTVTNSILLQSSIPFETAKEPVGLRAPFHRLIAAILLSLLAADLLLTQAVRLAGFSAQLLQILPGVLLLVLVAGYCQWHNFSKMVEICLLGVWGALFTHGLSVFILAACRTPAPLVDARLADIDGAMGFSTAAVVNWIAGLPVLRQTLAICYDLILPLILMALFLPVLLGQAARARHYLLSVMIAGGITAVLFAFLPSVGPWFQHTYQPAAGQAKIQAYIEVLKAGQWTQIDQESAGVVAFPSFHVVLATLAASALWPIRRARVPAGLLATLICISTITTGWHYGIDVIGGLAVAWLSFLFANRTISKMAAGATEQESNGDVAEAVAV